MLLKYQNLTIRNATIDDAEQLAIWWNDGTVMAYVGFPNGTGQTAKEIAAILKYDSEHTCRHLIIEVDHLPAGEMNYRIKDKDTVEIGIKICDLSLCNKGLGKKLLSMLIASLFSIWDINESLLTRMPIISAHSMFMKNSVLESCKFMKIHGKIN